VITGRPDESIHWQRLMVERAQSSSHPLSKAAGMIMAGAIAQVHGDPKSAVSTSLRRVKSVRNLGFMSSPDFQHTSRVGRASGWAKEARDLPR
jgi:hypothetical protein